MSRKRLHSLTPKKSPHHDPREDWPSLIVETGFSESQRQLVTDCHWRFANSDNEVKIVLLFDIPQTGASRVVIQVTQSTTFIFFCSSAANSLRTRGIHFRWLFFNISCASPCANKGYFVLTIDIRSGSRYSRAATFRRPKGRGVPRSCQRRSSEVLVRSCHAPWTIA